MTMNFCCNLNFLFLSAEVFWTWRSVVMSVCITQYLYDSVWLVCCHTFITEDSSPANITLARPIAGDAFITAAILTATVCTDKKTEWNGKERLIFMWFHEQWARWTYPDHSGLHICRSGTFHRRSRWNLCYTDTLRSRSSRPNTLHYRSRADLCAQDMAHSAPRKTPNNTSAPADTADVYLSLSCSVFFELKEWVTYDVLLQTGGSAADGQQSLFFEHPTEHTFPLPRRFLHTTGSHVNHSLCFTGAETVL